MSEAIDLSITWDEFSNLTPAEKEGLREQQSAFLGSDLKSGFCGKEWAIFSGLEKTPRATGEFSNLPTREDVGEIGKALNKPTFLYLSDVTIDFG